jgi:hypothetical protein
MRDFSTKSERTTEGVEGSKRKGRKEKKKEEKVPDSFEGFLYLK